LQTNEATATDPVGALTQRNSQVCLVLALVFVFVAGIDWSVRLIILLCCIIAQFLAAVWYSLSYIPYGRATVIKYGIKYGKQYCC